MVRFRLRLSALPRFIEKAISVLPVSLQLIHRMIRPFQQINIIRCPASVGNAYTDCNRRQAILCVHQLPVDLLQLGFDHCFLERVSIDHHDHKLITADSANTIISPEVLFQNCCDFDKYFVSHLMAVVIIDCFEIIGIHHQEIYRGKIELGEDKVISEAIIKPCQFIVGRLITQPLHILFIKRLQLLFFLFLLLPDFVRGFFRLGPVTSTHIPSRQSLPDASRNFFFVV